ncbi:C1 family peptidase [Methanothrix harundinacea]|uniref:C1 family peptidase n=1 Tax=Methanothrix harundinacea TaxID=301375 RepID=UPI0009D9D778|nr:C1 family peptidase [Methanothrix harundinacea]
MREIAVLAVAIFISFLAFSPAAAAAEEPELEEMKGAVLAAGGDWAAIEEMLATLSPEDRALVIATYPERIAELVRVRQAIEEAGASWEAGLNPVSILPPELRPGLGAADFPVEVLTILPGGGPSTDAVPGEWDWRNVSGDSWMTPIKDQGNCGSGWAFAALGAVEARMKLAANNPNLRPDLSEQYLLSCGPGNCSSGSSNLTADWLLCQGTVDDACFRYRGLDTVPCTESCFDRDARKYKIEGWCWVSGEPDVIDVPRIQQEVLFGGPVSSKMAVYEDFYLYDDDIYEHAAGALVGSQWVDILGWGTNNSTDYWICKNSWGAAWGDSGWFRIKMGDSLIGYEAVAYQPRIDGKVLFYEGHGPVYALLGNYSEWGNRLAGNGYLVHSSDEANLTAELLECYDVVVIANPGAAFTADELAAIKEFVGRGRVIAAGDGDLFENAVIYQQDNVKAAVQYVDWLASGNGGGLLLLGGDGVDWLPPIAPMGPADGPAPLAENDVINQVGDLFGLHFNADTVSDPLRYDGAVTNAILGPKEDILVIEASSLRISKDAFALARTTPSGYVTAAGGADPEVRPQEADVEAALNPEETPLSVMADEVLPPDVVPMPADGEVPPGGELADPAVTPDEDEELDASSEPVPMAGLSFTGPIVIAAIDFGRKGEDTIGVFRPSNQWWYLDYDNDAVPDFIIPYGLNGDQAIAGDWDGDGKDTIGVFRPSNQGWYLDYNNDAIPDFFIPYGLNGDQAVAGDWNGDGKDTIGVFRPSNQGWYLDYNNDAVPDQMIVYGLNGDLAVAGDWNGDGKDTIGVFRPSNRGWYLDYNNDAVPDQIIVYGLTGDVPVVGDWNGDGKDTIGVFRPSNRGWYLDYNNDAIPDLIIFYGLTGDQAIVGDWYKR